MCRRYLILAATFFSLLTPVGLRAQTKGSSETVGQVQKRPPLSGHLMLITISIAEDGKCEITTKPATTKDDIAPDTDPVNHGGEMQFEGAVVTKLPGGRLNVCYDFGSMKMLKGLQSSGGGATRVLDRERGLLVMAPAGPRDMQISLSRRFHLPLQFRLLVTDFETGHILPSFYFPGSAGEGVDWLAVDFWGKAAAADKKIPVEMQFATWFPWGVKWEGRKILLSSKWNADNLSRHIIRLPLTSVQRTKSVAVLLRASQSPLLIRQLSITGRLAAYFGFGMAERDDRVVITFIKEGPGGKAGLRPGDVLKTIDGVPVTSTKEAFRILGQKFSGDVVHLGLLRDGLSKNVEVVPE